MRAHFSRALTSQLTLILIFKFFLLGSFLWKEEKLWEHTYRNSKLLNVVQAWAFVRESQSVAVLNGLASGFQRCCLQNFKLLTKIVGQDHTLIEFLWNFKESSRNSLERVLRMRALERYSSQWERQRMRRNMWRKLPRLKCHLNGFEKCLESPQKSMKKLRSNCFLLQNKTYLRLKDVTLGHIKVHWRNGSLSLLSRPIFAC